MKQNLVFERLLIFFILIQPFIDLLTSLSIFAFDVNLTIGIFVRFGVMFLLSIYILISKYNNKKVIVLYLIIFALILLIGLINNFLIKEPISLFSELRNIAKIAYFPIFVFGYYIVFDRLKSVENLKEKVNKYIFISMLVVSIVMVLATITNTGILSYGSGKLGHQGWFFAGNELGAIMAVNFGIVMYYAIRQTKSLRSTIYWIPVLLMIYSMLQLGTKVGYGSALIILIIAMVMNMYRYIIRKKENLKREKVNIILNFIVLFLFIIFTPFTPVVSNMNTHLSWVGFELEPEREQLKQNESKSEVDLNEQEIERKKAVENIILSGREDFLTQYKLSFKDAPYSQKLLGMGYGGNNVNDGHPIEMDIYDIFFSIGIIGFLIYIIPILYFAVSILSAILRKFKNKFNIETVLVGSSIILGLGIAYTAGHVLTAPAVSIYLGILISYLYQRVTN